MTSSISKKVHSDRLPDDGRRPFPVHWHFRGVSYRIRRRPEDGRRCRGSYGMPRSMLNSIKRIDEIQQVHFGNARETYSDGRPQLSPKGRTVKVVTRPKGPSRRAAVGGCSGLASLGPSDRHGRHSRGKFFSLVKLRRRRRLLPVR